MVVISNDRILRSESGHCLNVGPTICSCYQKLDTKSKSETLTESSIEAEVVHNEKQDHIKPDLSRERSVSRPKTRHQPKSSLSFVHKWIHSKNSEEQLERRDNSATESQRDNSIGTDVKQNRNLFKRIFFPLPNSDSNDGTNPADSSPPEHAVAPPPEEPPSNANSGFIGISSLPPDASPHTKRRHAIINKLFNYVNKDQKDDDESIISSQSHSNLSGFFNLKKRSKSGMQSSSIVNISNDTDREELESIVSSQASTDVSPVVTNVKGHARTFSAHTPTVPKPNLFANNTLPRDLKKSHEPLTESTVASPDSSFNHADSHNDGAHSDNHSVAHSDGHSAINSDVHSVSHNGNNSPSVSISRRTIGERVKHLFVPRKGSFNGSSSNISDHSGGALSTSVSMDNICEKYGTPERVIGKGAGGTVKVFHFHQNGKEKLFAVKEFRKKRKNESSRDYLKKLTSEFCISSNLHHPNVVETIDLIQDENQHWCEIMEYCPGGDLYEVIREGKMTMLEINCCYKQLIMGVEYLHSMGVAHRYRKVLLLRDLKPENLLIDGHGHIKITDFGVSDVFQTCWEKEPHKSKGLCGSEPYIAPEEFSGDPYDARSCDIWSTGIIWYAMIFHGVPWRAAILKDPNYSYYLDHRHGHFEPFLRLQPAQAHLLEHIIEPDINKRITIAEMHQNPLFKAMEVCGENSIDASNRHHHHFTKEYAVKRKDALAAMAASPPVIKINESVDEKNTSNTSFETRPSSRSSTSKNSPVGSMDATDLIAKVAIE